MDGRLLNWYFREYYLEHGQGGTHTLQRNLIQLFNFLERERGFASPYTDGLNRYATVKGRPKTLSADFIDDLLEVTGSGRARDFETARDHAIIRILRSEGIRRAELLGMVMHTLPADVIRNPVFRLVPLKGHGPPARDAWSSLPRPAPAHWRSTCAPAATTALADSDWVWLGTRAGADSQNTGIRKMLIRRAEQAGYAGVTPHQFRHTFSDAWLKSGGSEGDLMRLNRSRVVPQAVDEQGDHSVPREESSVPAGGMQSFATAPSRSKGSTRSRMAPAATASSSSVCRTGPRCCWKYAGGAWNAGSPKCSAASFGASAAQASTSRRNTAVIRSDRSGKCRYRVAVPTRPGPRWRARSRRRRGPRTPPLVRAGRTYSILNRDIEREVLPSPTGTGWAPSSGARWRRGCSPAVCAKASSPS